MRYGSALYDALNNPKVDKTAFVAALQDSHLTTALKNYLKLELERAQSSLKTDYDKAGWPFYQAHKNGEVDTLKKLLDLLS